MKSVKLSADGKKLVARLKWDFDLDLPDDVVIRRTYAGWAQRARGAWSWFFYSPTNTIVYDIGSAERVRDLVRCKKISQADRELIIERGDYAADSNDTN